MRTSPPSPSPPGVLAADGGTRSSVLDDIASRTAYVCELVQSTASSSGFPLITNLIDILILECAWDRVEKIDSGEGRGERGERGRDLLTVCLDCFLYQLKCRWEVLPAYSLKRIYGYHRVDGQPSGMCCTL